jgi:hypothetical protein
VEVPQEVRSPSSAILRMYVFNFRVISLILGSIFFKKIDTDTGTPAARTLYSGVHITVMLSPLSIEFFQ